jgi:flagellar biosynthesis/type III secretory pathway chaperone
MTAQKPEHEVLYFQVTDLWKRLCEEHSTLLDYTCDEYSLLLASKLDELEETVSEKAKVIAHINKLDEVRQDLIRRVQSYSYHDINSVQDLVQFVQELDIEKEQKHFFRFNALLIDIIEKIQAQNKKNQIFLNKAILSLREIKQDASGQKNYSTYNAKGASRPGVHY